MTLFIVSAVAWSVVYSYTPFQAIRLALLMIIRDYLFFGALMATIMWCVIMFTVLVSRMLNSLSRFFSNRVLLSPPSHSAPSDSAVEWAYAFDVHTNAFFPLYLTLYLAQLFLVPIILRNNWICLFISNTLYLAA